MEALPLPWGNLAISGVNKFFRRDGFRGKGQDFVREQDYLSCGRGFNKQGNNSYGAGFRSAVRKEKSIAEEIFPGLYLS